MAKRSKTPPPPTATILIACRDAKGLVAGITDLLYANGANLLDADQHSDAADGTFFMRVAFDLTGFGLARDEIGPKVEELLTPHGPQVQVRFSDQKKRLAILVSKTDHCLYDLLLRHQGGQLTCEIPAVISNHTKLQRVAEHFDVPFLHLPITPETKPQQEAHLLAALEEHRVDLVVLARYMQILSPTVVDRYAGRIINIHHSFLPAFKGARPYHQAHARGVKVIGATGHYVTAELDQGPIICQDVVHVSHRDTVKDLVHKGQDLEEVVLARAVRWHVEDRVLIQGNRTVVFA
jgi:formyltetrahydrofolate deformylase